MKKLITGLCLATTLALPLTAVAEPDHGPAGRHHCHEDGRHHDGEGFHARDGKPFFLRDLTLTPEQDGKIQALLREQQPALEAKFKAAHQAKRELRQLAVSGQFDDKQAQRLAQTASAAEADAALLRARLHAQLLQQLTPEQRRQVQQRLQEKAAAHADAPADR